MIISKLEIRDLAKQGPHFVYDLDGLSKHAKQIASGHAKLFFACKANPLSAIISTLNEVGACFDVASVGELNQVLSTGVLGNKIIMTGPAKTKELIALGLENKIDTFVIESPNQLRLLQDMAHGCGYEPRILLRLQLRWKINKKNALGGGNVVQFGVDLDTAKILLKEIRLPFLGFHVFQWGNILELNELKQIWDTTISACKSLATTFDVLDVGGGLGIPYQNEIALEWNDVNNAIAEFKLSHKLKEFWLELGRYLVGPYGYYVTRVVDRKRTFGEDFLILEGGVNHLARPSIVQEYFPAMLMRQSSSPLKSFRLCGPLCTSTDFLGKHMLPSDADVGDVIIFKQVGAYGFTESMPFFLCHNLAGEVALKEGKIVSIRPPASAQSWMK